MGGIVYLVGAGPGDPGLLTLRGAELIKRAEVVVYDYLAFPGLLALAPKGAELIYVGKIGAQHAMPQAEINRLLVKLGQDGKIVVRLKGGDPYIFGRGGEEAMELYNAGVPFEVIPGISSTVAAAAYAGIPLTHRDLSSQVVLITGHERPDRETSAHDWKALAKIGTLVAVMGREQLSNICQKLIESGKPADTPAAMVEWGATPKQRTAYGDLLTLPVEVEAKGIEAPALLVVGDVVSLNDKLNWFETRELWGKSIMVTRTREQAGQISARLSELGANVVERPVISIREIYPNPSLDKALSQLDTYGLLILTSPNGASIFLKALWDSGRDARSLLTMKIAVMGPGTAEAMRPYGLRPDIVPEKFIAEDLLIALGGTSPTKTLLPRASEARNVLVEGLAEKGFHIDEVPLYETVLGGALDTPLKAPFPDLVTLASGSSARGLAAIVPDDQRKEVLVASIGPITSEAAKFMGFTVVSEAKEHTIGGLIAAVLDYFKKRV
jgi:uroporphyrinogen III methyltransferase/synthase